MLKLKDKSLEKVAGGFEQIKSKHVQALRREGYVIVLSSDDFFRYKDENIEPKSYYVIEAPSGHKFFNGEIDPLKCRWEWIQNESEKKKLRDFIKSLGY